MALADRFNKILAPIGLEIRRVHSSYEKRLTPTRSAGVQVEMIGPSGVGKSYIYHQLDKKYRKGWLSREQLRRLSTHAGYFNELEGKDSSLYEELLRRKYAAIWEKDIPLWRKHRLYNFFLTTLAMDSFGRERCLTTTGFFIDEGVQQNFGQELHEIHAQYSVSRGENWKQFEAFMQGRSAVMVDADEDFIMHNLELRHEDLKGLRQNDWLAYMPKKDALEKVIAAKEAKARWLEIVAEFGGDTLVIDASDELSVNTSKLASFLESILYKKE